MLTVFHTNEHRGTKFLVYATGVHQWLGDAYYFWQDEEFAEEWALNTRNNYSISDIYNVEIDIDFSDDFVIDTVFNEKDYYKFVEKIEYFGQLFYSKFKRKPNLEEFNNFVQDNSFVLWKNIVAIRFQDLPLNSNKDYLRVKNFFYKKRIQIALFDATKIIQYSLLKTINNKL